jgi:hypothetical protein
MNDPKIVLTPTQIGELVKAANAPSPTIFQKVLLRGFKMSGDEVRKLSQMFGVVQSILGVIGTITGALATIKAVLDLTGLLKPDDPFKDIKDAIEGHFLALKDFYQDEEDEQQVERRIGWEEKITAARAALSNLNNSRSENNFDDAVTAFNALGTALFEMLATAQINDLQATVPAAGSITFAQAAYAYPPADYADPPEHWLAYAMPTCMRTTGGRPVQYNATADNLTRRIWDPGYYIDTLTSGVAYFISLLVAIEPAFRATGHARQQVTYLAKALDVFVAAWRGSLFVTNVDVFLPPNSYQDRTYLQHPFGNPYQPLKARGIPLGVVDPVSGLAAFMPVWDEDFVFGTISPAPPPVSGVIDDRRTLTNSAAARGIAIAALADAVKGMEAVCGIRALEILKGRVAELGLYGLGGSMFTKIKRGEKAPPLGVPRAPGMPWLLEPNFFFAPEFIELGEIGAKAGKPGKKYRATRFFDPNLRTFRIPMVRRMDGSGIQLGYRLEARVGSDDSNSASLVLAAFDAVVAPSEQAGLALFPSAPLSLDVGTDQATLYDVIQSAHFTTEDEERFERGEFDFARQRLFVDPRPGTVALRFDVTFEFDRRDPNHYIGYANVEIVNLDPAATLGFIVQITVFEEAKTAVGTYMSADPIEEQKEIIADTTTVHMVPSYLLAEADYFEDRQAGLVVLDKSILDIRQTLDLMPKPWERGGGGPLWRIRDLAYNEALKVRAFTQFERYNPALAASVVSRFQPPALKQRKR